MTSSSHFGFFMSGWNAMLQVWIVRGNKQGVYYKWRRWK